MTEAIHGTKARLSSKYLGVAGIHAIGSRPGNIVSVYYSGPHSEGRDKVFRQIEAEANPFSVVFVQEDPPSAAQV
jgi:hypothetical protein